MKMNLKKMRLPMGVFAIALSLFSMTSCGVFEDGTINIDDYVGVSKAPDFDPSKPITITGFTPEKGGVGQQIVIQGTNFGNDTSLVDLKIGNKQAVVVSVKGDCMYAYVPSKAFLGNIELSIGNQSTGVQSCVAEKKFVYDRKMVVGRLAGYRNADDTQGWVDGPFDGEDGVRYAGAQKDGIMQFSPYNHDQLFVLYDQEPFSVGTQHGIQLIDLKKRRIDTIIPLGKFNNERIRTIDFAVDPFQYSERGELIGYADADWVNNQATPNELRWREHLIVVGDNYDVNYKAHCVYIVDRDQQGNFSKNSNVTQLCNYNQCNSAVVLPFDKSKGETYHKELYFTCYTDGTILRLDFDAYWDKVYEIATYVPDEEDPNAKAPDAWNPNGRENDAIELLYQVQDSGYEMQLDVHPSGKYAYIVVINRYYVLRTDYDEESRRFLPAYTIAGSLGDAGLQDGVGTNAKFSRPYQGTFVKNDEYEAAGKADIYDFYISDNTSTYNIDVNDSRAANAIRLLTPEGIVRTYAGGSRNTHADNRAYGSENGELRDVARFNRPTGIVNDVHIDKVTGNNTLIFYILDTGNRQFRTITIEEPDDEDMEGVNE